MSKQLLILELFNRVLLSRRALIINLFIVDLICFNRPHAFIRLLSLAIIFDNFFSFFYFMIFLSCHLLIIFCSDYHLLNIRVSLLLSYAFFLFWSLFLCLIFAVWFIESIFCTFLLWYTLFFCVFGCARHF